MGLVSLYKRHILSITRNAQCGGDWYKTVCKSASDDSLTLSGVRLPGFPPEEVQLNTTGATGKNTLCEAFIFYEDCLERFVKSPGFANKNKSLLDFGVGWGRILRFFMKDFQPENLYGVDINQELLEICESTFQWGTFIKSEAYPPLALPDNSFDFIVGYSVFSHLSEEACLKWVKEFSRILRPGGGVAVTTRGRWFMDYCESLRGAGVQGYSKGLSELFSDFDAAREKYDRGEFVHANGEWVTGGGPLRGDFYGETFIPEQYARTAYSKYFRTVEFNFQPKRATHPIIFLEK